MGRKLKAANSGPYTPEAYNQVWHLPTDRSQLTGIQWIELFARQMNVEPEY